MSLDEFFALLEKTPRYWFLFNGMIRRRTDICVFCCPWSEVAYVGGRTQVVERKVDIWNAADNVPGHDPALRQRLLAACGLTATE